MIAEYILINERETIEKRMKYKLLPRIFTDNILCLSYVFSVIHGLLYTKLFRYKPIKRSVLVHDGPSSGRAIDFNDKSQTRHLFKRDELIFYELIFFYFCADGGRVLPN